MPDTWKDASDSVNKTYQVFKPSALKWKLTSRSTVHKTRAKLVIGNILTVGLMNLYMLVSHKAKAPQREFTKQFKEKLNNLSVYASPKYGLDRTALLHWLYFFFDLEKEPEVTPGNTPEFAFGWQQFLDDNYDHLKEVAKKFHIKYKVRN